MFGIFAAFNHSVGSMAARRLARSTHSKKDRWCRLNPRIGSGLSVWWSLHASVFHIGFVHVLQFFNQSLKSYVRWIDEAKLPPERDVTDWRPVQGVPRLHPNDYWDTHQPTETNRTSQTNVFYASQFVISSRLCFDTLRSRICPASLSA